MVISTVVLTGTVTPIVKKLYNPSKRYATTKRRTIEHASSHDSELRLLACVHHHDNTPSLIRLLDISNPTTTSPLCFYVVHLIPLAGRSTPLLITHRPGRRTSFHSTLSDRIIHAFRLFEHHNSGKVMMSPITAMAPCASMHNDVCSLAFEKRACIVIVPFHKQYWSQHGAAATANNHEALRAVNLNILRNTPCSVGILVDRGSSSSSAAVNYLSSKGTYSVGVIFIEGPDDREALAYAMRMAGKANVCVTVIRLVDSYVEPSQNDLDMVDKFKAFLKSSSNTSTKKKHFYKEKAVKNSLEMINVIRSMENQSYNLILVGRRHFSESPLFAGLTEWNEYPELGSIGDVLASGDTNSEFSLLVVQQHAFEGVKDPDSPKYHVMMMMNSAVSVQVDVVPSHHHNNLGSKVTRPRPVPVSMETNRKSRDQV
ncbi:hypothetical protein L484_011139 [Morus notabilis]|uniref:Cation/H(+) antiporter 15 n=2 Tax=Morus notabilis TaxID=981085 RepID=W9R9X4_9ROSA|nr:hypothetical protein L484_011139 [Morus notabilis]